VNLINRNEKRAGRRDKTQGEGVEKEDPACHNERVE